MVHPHFKLRHESTEGIVNLLSSVTLGTNGAKYVHLDAAQRISEADTPLFLSLERNDKVLANVTFCRRDKYWYVRYFAFDPKFQSAGKTKSTTSKGMLKSGLHDFFTSTLTNGYDGKKVSCFYAYIDPRNEKSLWLSENFGFKTVAQIATQTFSRVNPRKTELLEKVSDWELIKEIVQHEFSEYHFFDAVHLQKGPFYVLKNESGGIIACTKIDVGNWEIKRLPGKFGGLLSRIIPFIPGIRKIVRPKKHTFAVPEAVWVKNNDPSILSSLFEGILAEENLNLIIWWTDVKTPLYQSIRMKIRWGILNRLVGVSMANVVLLENEKDQSSRLEKPIYTIGFDFI